MRKLRRLNILRIICYAYFLLVCIFWLMDSGFPGYINWPILTITALILAQLLIRIPYLDVILGIILSIGAFYMLLAVSSDLADHFNGTKPVKAFRTYFGFGYAIFGSAWAAAGGIIYTYYARRRLRETAGT